jgi:hypothetical protein
MTALRWLFAGLLIWGFFTGIGFVLTPYMTDGWGNDLSTAAGVVMILVCAVALLSFDPRRG